MKKLKEKKMTLIEIIKASLLGFSTLFVLSWIFFYLFLKFRKANSQSTEENTTLSQTEKKIVQIPVVRQTPVYVQPVIYPSVSRVNNNEQLAVKYPYPSEYKGRSSSRRREISNQPARFVVFNNKQFGFYNA
jgi:hypothetical protein